VSTVVLVVVPMATTVVAMVLAWIRIFRDHIYKQGDK
jgi:ABC-type spermidine/putrescine transport system permease subunit I